MNIELGTRFSDVMNIVGESLQSGTHAKVGVQNQFRTPALGIINKLAMLVSIHCGRVTIEAYRGHVNLWLITASREHAFHPASKMLVPLQHYGPRPCYGHDQRSACSGSGATAPLLVRAMRWSCP